MGNSRTNSRRSTPGPCAHNNWTDGELVKLFAPSGRIKLIASPPVIAGAERAMKYPVDLYLGPPRTLYQTREMMDQRSADAIGEFATLCREEFRLPGLA